MLDKQYIEEIKLLDKKEAKTKLDEYASQFGIKLKKTKSFENMVEDLEVEMAKLAAEPMPEVDGGLSITDLIEASDELEGKSVFKGEASESAMSLIGDTITVAAGDIVVEVPKLFVESIGAPIGDKVVVVTKDEVIELPVEPVDEVQFKAAVEKIIEAEGFKLPDNFSPNLSIIGKNPGYVTLPWWIYQWISETPDWKERPTSFQHPSAHQTLFSLIYYIKRDGSVMIRETRNSSFVTLE